MSTISTLTKAIIFGWLSTPVSANDQAIFSGVLKQIQTHHAYLKESAIDMSCLKQNYPSTVTQPAADTLQLMEHLMLEFADNHMHLNTNHADSYRLYGPVTVELQNNRFTINDFWKNQTEDPVGLDTGAELLTINGQTPQQIIAQFPTRCLDKTQVKNQEWIINKALAGVYSQPRIITFEKHKQKHTVDLDALKYHKHTGMLQHQVKDNIGIIQLHDSLGQTGLIQAFDEAIDTMHHTDGLVLDLRNTISGGDSYLARAIIGRLIKQARPYQQHRFIEQRDNATGIPRTWVEWVEPRGTTYEQPVVVLVNHWTGSMGEGLAIGLDGMNRATLIGTEMAGLLGAINGFSIKGLNYGFQMPTEQLFHVNGTPREQVIPQHVIKPDGSKTDNIMAAATQFLLAQKHKSN